MAWKGGVRTKLMIRKETAFSRSRRNFILALRKDHAMHLAIAIFIVFILVLSASLTLLPTSNYTAGNPLRVSYSMEAGMHHSFVVSFDLTPGAYANTTYNLGSSVAKYTLSVSPYNALSLGGSSVVQSKTITGSGQLSFHGGNSAKIVTILLNVTAGNSFSTFSFDFTATSFYTNNVNPILYSSAIWIFTGFAVVLAGIITNIFRDPHSYWLKLDKRGKYKTGRKSFKAAPMYQASTNRDHWPAWLWFFMGIGVFAGITLNINDSTSVIVLNLFLLIIGFSMMKFGLLLWVVNRDSEFK